MALWRYSVSRILVNIVSDDGFPLKTLPEALLFYCHFDQQEQISAIYELK